MESNLGKKYVELEVINNLIQELGTSLEVKPIMNHLVGAIKKLYPNTVTAFYLFGLEAEANKKIFVYSPFPIKEDYIDTVLESVSESLKSKVKPINTDIKVPASSPVSSKIDVEIVEGKIDNKSCAVPKSQISFPFNTSDFCGIINFSCDEKNFFDKHTLGVLRSILTNTSDTINRLRTMVDSEHSRLKDLVESMSDGVLMFDINNRVIIVNSLITNLIGLSEKSFSLEKLIEMMQSLIKQKKNEAKIDLNAAIKEMFVKKELIRFEEIEIKKEVFELLVIPVRDSNGCVSGGALILHDITHKKEVSRMKAEFVAIASHQLRSPLTCVNWYLEMLLRGDAGELTEDQIVFLKEAYKGSKQMAALVSDLLSISRLEAGRITIDPYPTNINELVLSIAEETEILARKKGCAVSVVQRKELPQIPVDRALLHHVIYNLTDNAIKYSHPDKKSKVTISIDGPKVIREAPGSHKYVTVSVKDEGMGIPKKNQAMLFNKFYRADNVTKMAIEGTGLGLYISKLIIESSGGQLWFRSTENKGSVFSVAIPHKGMTKVKGEVKFK